MNNRCIILHFHFFKNAGTSIESILRKNFDERFITHELGGPAEAFPSSEFLPLLNERKDIAAISSHTIHFPVPESPDYTILPIVFLRHPLDRILSMYNFEKKQGSQQPGSSMANELTIAEYIRVRRKNPLAFTLRNYQMWMMSRTRAHYTDYPALFEVAKQQLESIPVVGVVEEFSESVTQLTEWLQPYFPGLDMQPEHENRSALSDMNIDKRLDMLKQEIGTELYSEIESENSWDIELHRIATKRLLENKSS